MTAKERRQAIIEILCQRRKETRANLAAEFGVTMRTIEYDIVELSLQYPIYTKQGSDGGIFVVDGFDLGRKYLPKSQTDFLESLLDRLSATERIEMKKILRAVKRPQVKENT